MNSFKQLSTSQKIGKILLVLISLALIMGSFGMIIADPNSKEALEMTPLHLESYVRILGIIKLLVGLGLFFPKTRRIAALVGTGYLGGALMANITLGEFPIVPVVFILALWIGMELLTKDFLQICCCKGTCPVHKEQATEKTPA